MVNKCPKCGFEPIGDKLVCPKCGFEIKENIAKKIKDDHLEGVDHIEEIEQDDNNDNIKWSDYKDVSIGSMMEQLGEQTKSEDEESEEESDILAAYIREHQVEGSAKDSEPTEENAEEVEETVDANDLPEEELILETAEPEVAAEEAEATDNEGAPAEDTQTSEEPTPLVAEKTEEVMQPTVEVEPTGPKEPAQKSKKRLYWTAACALLVFGAGGGWLYHNHQEATQQAQALKIQNELDQLSTELNSFYLDDQHQFIKSGKTLEDLAAIQEKLKDYQNEPAYKKLSAEATAIEEKLTVLAELNAFFDAPIVVGDELKDVHLKDGQAINMAKLVGDDAFSKLINQAIEKGQKEFAQIEEVRNAVKSTTAQYKDGQLADGVTQDSYQNLMKQVNALANANVKEALINQLKPIEAALIKREQASVQAQVQEAQAAQEAAAVQEPQQGQESAAAGAYESGNATQEPAAQDSVDGTYILAPNTPSQPDNQPIIPPRASDIADINNPAWIWNPGVKEKIIQTAIERGYVVEGGYMFKPVRIENGEGYYNFYATNTKSNLMQGISESALPFYLFTVNDKTGYFRGNGNDHTIR